MSDAVTFVKTSINETMNLLDPCKETEKVMWKENESIIQAPMSSK